MADSSKQPKKFLGLTTIMAKKRIWAKRVTPTSIRFTKDDMKMLKELVRILRLSQNAVMITALRKLHEEETTSSLSA